MRRSPDNLVNSGGLAGRSAGSSTALSEPLLRRGGIHAAHGGLWRHELEPTLANQVETLLFDPTVLFILFILAAICIYLELAIPAHCARHNWRAGAAALSLRLAVDRSELDGPRC